MNKIDEIALRVAEKLEPRGRTYSPEHYIEFASALLAELSKESKPHCWKCEATHEDDIGGEDEVVICFDEAQMRDYRDESSYTVTPLFTHPANTAEIEQRVADLQSKVKVLTNALELAKEYSAIWPQHIDVRIDEALATVKDVK